MCLHSFPRTLIVPQRVSTEKTEFNFAVYTAQDLQRVQEVRKKVTSQVKGFQVLVRAQVGLNQLPSPGGGDNTIPDVELICFLGASGLFSQKHDSQELFSPFSTLLLHLRAVVLEPRRKQIT